MVKGDWDKIQRFMAEYGRKPGDMTRVYSNFVWVLKNGARSPSRPFPHFKSTRHGSPYWKEFYLLGRPRRSPIRSGEGRDAGRLRVGGAESPQLELGAARAARREVLPRVAKR
jgi:hypothetical protein